jgi:hypothetical protein
MFYMGKYRDFEAASQVDSVAQLVRALHWNRKA